MIVLSCNNLNKSFGIDSILQDVSFTVNEVDPYDAETVAMVGSFRGLNASLERNLWKTGNSLSGNLVSGGNSRRTTNIQMTR